MPATALTNRPWLKSKTTTKANGYTIVLDAKSPCVGFREKWGHSGAAPDFQTAAHRSMTWTAYLPKTSMSTTAARYAHAA